MNFDIVTINPDFFVSPLKNGLIYKGIKKKIIYFNIWNLMDFKQNNYGVDDKIYGGGAGLLMQPKPLYYVIKKIRSLYKKTFIIHVSPQGQLINLNLINQLLCYDSLVFICSRYSGIDQRIIDNYIDMEISIGDFVLSCGEICVLVIIDLIIRNIPGILNNIDSCKNDSFNFKGLLGYPNYTRPYKFNNFFVPKILLSGHHKEINLWRLKQSLIKTLIYKPYLLSNFFTDKDLIKFFKQVSKYFKK